MIRLEKLPFFKELGTVDLSM